MKPTVGLACLLAIVCLIISGQNAVAGEWVARHGMSGGQYQSAFDQYTGQGYRLVAVDGYAVGSAVQYAAIWEKTGGPGWVARHGLNASAYQTAFNQYSGQSYRPRDISATAGGQGSGTFAALWDQSPGGWVARHGLTSAQYQQAFDKFVGQDYRLADVEGYAGAGGVVRYAALWVKSGNSAWRARHGLTSAQYQSAFDQTVGQGYRLTHVDGYWTPAGVRYAAIWEKTGGGQWAARHGLSSAQYQAAFNQYVGQGYRLVHVSGYWDGQQARYAAIWSK